MDRVSALVRNDREIFEGSVVAAEKQNACAARESDGKASAVTIGAPPGENVGATIDRIEQGIEIGLVLFAKPGERVVRRSFVRPAAR